METFPNTKHNITSFSSYPTYEEWKRKISGSLSKHCISSYPTYEEWKPRTINWWVLLKSLFLSYLWGMETLKFSLQIHLTFLFLSYLWGMETIVSGVIRQFQYKFLSYLWGMETQESNDIAILHTTVLILPMRNKKTKRRAYSTSLQLKN